MLLIHFLLTLGYIASIINRGNRAIGSISNTFHQTSTTASSMGSVLRDGGTVIYRGVNGEAAALVTIARNELSTLMTITKAAFAVAATSLFTGYLAKKYQRHRELKVLRRVAKSDFYKTKIQDKLLAPQ